MSHYEFFTLCFLAKHSRWVFTNRKKLNPDDPKNGYIKTVVNSGYKFDA